MNVFGIELTLAERWNGAGWRTLTSPNPAGASYSVLSGVSCASPAECTAAGYYFNRAGTRIFPLAERWNGIRWAVQPVPGLAGYQNSGFFAVSCPSKRACTAVGAAFQSSGQLVTLAETWNGIRWASQATPGPAGSHGSQLNAVACTSARACTATGYYLDSAGTQVTLAERENGSRWASQPTPEPSGALASDLSAVSCHAPRACTAAGFYAPGSAPPGVNDVLIETWNGTNWRIQPAPSPPPPVGVHSGSELDAVSCTSARACTAVGSYTGLISHTGLTGLTLAERWTGTHWRIQHTPSPSGGTLSAVWCSPSGGCVAAGNASCSIPTESCPIPAPVRTLAETWHSGRWRIQATVNRLGARGFEELNAVSCTPSGACTAAGDYLDGAGGFAPLAERRSGARWTIQPMPNPKGAIDTILRGVSCASAQACIAVGFSFNRAGTRTFPLAERWNGTRWVIQPTVQPAGATDAQLFGVSCVSPRSCVGVGRYSAATGGSLTLAERWNGTRWALQPAPTPSGAYDAEFSGVSCTSPRACTAVGDYYLSSAPKTYVALAERWNGTRWAIQHIPSPGRATDSTFYGVSCATASACTAVGGYTNSGGAAVTLAGRWNGTRWAMQPTPNPPGAADAQLSGVSCASATACTAVGYDNLSNGAYLLIAEAWNGTNWRLQAAPSPASALDSALSGVSCPSTSDCTATGSYPTLANVTATLAITTSPATSSASGRPATPLPTP